MQKDVCDVNNLPQAPTFQSYANKPIQNFGLSLLYKMGYQQGKGIGKRRQNQLSQPLVLKSRPKGLGLGAQQQKAKQQQDLVTGDYVKITSQPHKGLNAILIEIINEKTNQVEKQSPICHVQLIRSGAKLKLKKENLTKIGKSEVQLEQKEIKQQSEKKQHKKKRLKWVQPNIRVKIVDKDSPKYLQKLVVTQVINEREFEARQQHGTLLSGLRQKDLQTVIPKPGSTVLILKGKHAREKAKLLERNKSKQQVIVQTLAQFEVIKLDQDDVSQYVDT